MPPEDQNTGETPETQETPSPETEIQETPQSQSSSEETPPVEAGEDGQHAVEEVRAEPGNKVSDALKAFESARNDNGFPKPSTQVQQPEKKGRDYSNLSAEEIPLFKKMGDRSFEVLKPIFLEHKQLKKDYEKLKSEHEASSKVSFFEHEEAYQLSPEYKNLSANASSLDAEIDYWQQQLINIREGKNWAPLVLNEKGQPAIGAEQDPTPRAEAIILNGLQQAHALKTDVTNKLTSIQSSFSSQHKGFINGLAAVEKKVFEGADTATLDKAMATKLPLFPTYLHNRPEIRALAKALAVIDGMAMLLDEAKAAKATATIKTKTATNGGPRAGELAPGNGKVSTVGAVLDEFKKARMQGVA